MPKSDMPKLDMKGRWFVDEFGRRVILRGVNLGGDCKVPYPYGVTQHPSYFSNHRTVSFIGRPFPLAEADEHFGRLRHWGFNCLRLLTTWEAVEHAGPGQYDEAYLDYFAEIARKAGDYGLYVFIDFHQDVWSRMSGGDGAPGWTFEAVGLDLTKFHEAGAAHVMQYKYDYAKGGRQDSYPQMTWSSNYRLPANAIMWTLFFGGATFTPQFMVDGVNAQEWLQDKYIGAMRAVAQRVAHLPHVIGFDTLNEPGEGWIGEKLVRGDGEDTTGMAAIMPGLAISPLDALLVAQGVPRDIPVRALDRQSFTVKETGKERLNPNGVSIWLKGASDPFEIAGAYTMMEGGKPLRDDFFTHRDGRKLSIEADFMNPFFHRVANAIRAVREDWMVFAEVSPFRAFAGEGFAPGAPPRTVNASHWYDIQTLATKKFSPKELRADLNDRGAQDVVAGKYTAQLGHIAKLADSLSADSAPTLIGEFGIPFDLNEGKAYAAWADGDRSSKPWQEHELALRLMYEAMDRLLISSTQWNYTASNRNDAATGDNWNQEDLSIYSKDQSTGPNDPSSGGRAVKGFSRPFARRIQGEPRSLKFDPFTHTLELSFDADPKLRAPTEIFVPLIHFPSGAKVDAPNCDAEWIGQTILHIRAKTPGLKLITVTRL